MTRSSWLWLAWILCPVFGLSFHYGPGQLWLARDRAGEKIEEAIRLAGLAETKQESAYQVQLELIEARRLAFVGGIDWQSQPDHALSIAVREVSDRQAEAYRQAGEAWSEVTEQYTEAIQQVVKTLQAADSAGEALAISDQYLLESLRWAEARAMVRSGMVFNGVDQFQALLDVRISEMSVSADSGSNSSQTGSATSRLPTDAIREELAAAQYIGARLLREEGRSPEIWKPVANAARQQYRLLAERELGGDAGTLGTAQLVSRGTDSPSSPPTDSVGATKSGEAVEASSSSSSSDETGHLTRAERIQRNLEQVLNLEQSSAEQLEGIPLPRQAPMARRPGDGEPGDRPGKGPGRGPMQDGPPGDGAGIPGPFGSGW